MCYYAYKLHAAYNTDGVFSDFELTKASVHNIYHLKNIKQHHANCTILADKGYLNINYQLDLFEQNKLG